MTFEEKIKKLRLLLFEIVKPSISEIIELRNYKEFVEKWKRNCCKQTSLLTNALLREILLNNDTGYIDIESWEGWFHDYMFGKNQKYNHAWIYCINKDPNKNLFIDIGRNHKELLCFFTPVNQYPKSHEDYKHQRLERKELLDFKEHMLKTEHFTGLPGALFIKELKKFMNKQTLLSATSKTLYSKPLYLEPNEVFENRQSSDFMNWSLNDETLY